MSVTFGSQVESVNLGGNGSKWNRTSTVWIGLAFTRELMEPFQTEPLAVPEQIHLETLGVKNPVLNFLNFLSS